MGRAQDLDARAAKLEPSPWKRRQSATVIVHPLPWLGPVDARLVFFDLGRVGDTLIRLWRELQAAALKSSKRAHHQVGAARREHIVELAGRHVGTDRYALCRRHWAGIKPLLHAHRCRAALGIARHDGAIDRGGAAPAR